MIYPYISYCNMVWASNYISTLNCIFILQKRFIKMITFSNKFTSSTPLFQSLKILPIHELNNLQICIFIYQSIHNLLPACFQNIFQFNNDIHNHYTRASVNLHSAFFRTTSAQFSIMFRGPHFWNNIPSHIRDHNSIKSFKKHLFTFLLTNLD